MYTQSLFTTFTAAVALAGTIKAAGVQHRTLQTGSPYIYPDILDASKGSDSLVKFIHGYFTAKSLHDLDAWLKYFHATHAIYSDATLGTTISQPNFTATLKPLFSGWGPDAKSYPLRIIGDMDSAVIMFVDTPAMFGAEIRAIATLDFKDNKVIRQVDYWDGRGKPIGDMRVPDDQYPINFGESTIRRSPHPKIKDAANKMHAALSNGSAMAAMELFTIDAVLEDRSTHTRIEGQLDIGNYLHRALPTLPYGVGSTLRHVVGSADGGAYEWEGGPGAVGRNGIITLDLDKYGRITQLTTVWDTSRASQEIIMKLAQLSIE